MPKIDPETCPAGGSSTYPAPYRDAVRARRFRRIGQGAGLTDFGATLATIPPGTWSSQRHWHEQDDELLVMLSGELVLIENETRTTLRAGDIAAWPKDTPNGHHLINESAADATFLAIGNNGGDCHYPDIDLEARGDENFYRHNDGTPYRAYTREEW